MCENRIALADKKKTVSEKTKTSSQKLPLNSVVQKKLPDNSVFYDPPTMKEILERTGLCSESLSELCLTTVAPTIRHLIGSYGDDINPRIDTLEDVGTALKTHWIINPGHEVFSIFNSEKLSLIATAMNAKKIEIANGSGITRQALHEIMTGKSIAMLKTARRIGDYLKVTFYTDIRPGP